MHATDARRVLIAPDSFKGSASATEIAQALAEGWSSRRPHDELRLVPMADGGEGTLDVIEFAVARARRQPVDVPGPDGEPVRTHWLLLRDGTGVVELAATSGLTLSTRRQPFAAHTVGFGQAIAAALDAGVHRLLLAIGGSASTDGGTGALAALGGRFLRADGNPVRLGNDGLAELAAVDLSGLRPAPRGGADVLTDVINPLLGARGAAAIFGPQKGAHESEVPRLDANLAHLAPHLAIDPATPGAGAAGGTGFGLMAWGARLVAGSAAVASTLGIPDGMGDCDVLITGEGRFDEQSTSGKVAGYLASLAAAHGVRALLVAGRIDAPTRGLFDATVALVDIAGDIGDALARPLRYARTAGARLADRSA